MDTKKLAYLGLGAVLLFLVLKPKKAKAEEVDEIVALIPPEDPPAPPAQGTPEQSIPAQQSFKDPGTGQTIQGPSAPIQSGTRYTVRAGESWSNIASRTYGDYRWWPFLWDKNRTGTMFTSPDSLTVGDSITLPVAVPEDLDYKAMIFARAKAHAEWYVANRDRIKAGGRPRPVPPSVTTATPLPASAQV